MRYFAAVSLFSVLLLAPFEASATPTVLTADCSNVFGIGTCATGIAGLEILSGVFDVSFIHFGSYDTIFATQDPTFLGNPAGAQEAAQAIVDALSPSGVDGILGNGGVTTFFVPYYYFPNIVYAAFGEETGGFFLPPRLDGSVYPGFQYFQYYSTEYMVNYAVFTPSSVPDAAPVFFLFGGAVAAVEGLRRNGARGVGSSPC